MELVKQDQMLSIIDKLANSDVDISKMQAIIGMRNQELERQAKGAFAESYVLLQADLPLVMKKHDNLQTKSKYAKLEDINETIKSPLKNHGFGVLTPIKNQTDTHVTVEITLLHKGGYSESREITLPIDNKGMAGTVNKTSVHGIASTVMYARRIGVCALLNISTGDDNDGNTTEIIGEFATEMQREAISKLFMQLLPEQQKYFNEREGGITTIKKLSVDTIIANLKKTLGDNARNN